MIGIYLRIASDRCPTFYLQHPDHYIKLEIPSMLLRTDGKWNFTHPQSPNLFGLDPNMNSNTVLQFRSPVKYLYCNFFAQFFRTPRFLYRSILADIQEHPKLNMSKGKNKTFLKRKRTLQTFKSSVEYNEMYYLNVKSAICHLSLKSIPHFGQPNNSN